MLQSEGGDPAHERRTASKMIDEGREKSCGRLVAIISEMSEVSKLESGQIQLERKPVDILKLAADKGERSSCMRRRIAMCVLMSVDLRRSGARLSGDNCRLRAGFVGDFSSDTAREQGSGDGVVAIDRRLDVQNGASSAVIVIAEESAVQAAYGSTVEPFDEKRGGLGLGLPYARRVVEGHGGLAVWAPTPENDDDRGLRSAIVISFPLPELNR